MSYIREVSGQWTEEVASSKTTTAYAVGEFVYDDGTNLIPATSSTKKIYGICQTLKAVGTADTSNIYIRKPKERSCTFRATVTNTLTKAMEGKAMDLASSTTVNATGTSCLPVRCVKFISATEGVFEFNDGLANS